MLTAERGTVQPSRLYQGYVLFLTVVQVTCSVITSANVADYAVPCLFSILTNVFLLCPKLPATDSIQNCIRIEYTGYVFVVTANWCLYLRYEDNSRSNKVSKMVPKIEVTLIYSFLSEQT